MDGWRGYAILWILVGHVVNLYNIDYRAHLSLLFVDFATNLVVDVFFVISGYLMAEKWITAREQIDLKKFFLKRSSRVLPLYFGIVFLVIIVHGLVPAYTIRVENIYPAYELTYGEIARNLFSQPDALPPYALTFLIEIKNDAASFWPNLFLIQNYYPLSLRVKLLEHTWFVAVIMHFYIFYGLLTFFLDRVFNEPRKRQSAMLYICIVLILLVITIRAMFGRFYPFYYQMTHFRIDAILFGCVLNLAKGFRSNMNEGIQWTKIKNALYLCSGIAILVALIARWPPLDRSHFTSVFTLSYISFGLMIISTMDENRFSRIILRNPLISWIGYYSYGIYLWHYPFMFFYRLLAMKMQWSDTFSIATFCILSIVIGAGLQHLFEKASRLAKSVI
jgi:peptidoglycan/LPS O-acetylase OafA/YrhL